MEIPPGGANGTRVWFDWWQFGPGVRNGIKVGFRLHGRSEDYVKDASARIKAALQAFADQDIKDDVVLGQMRAALDHAERCAREAQQETEDRARGDHSPVFLEVRPIA